jgi:NADPH2:quinone reductase
MGVSRPDILIRKGVYTWMPPLPASPGNELTGVIEAVGGEINDLAVGQAVLLSARDLPVRGGCYSEFVAAPADAVYRLPDGVSFDEAVVLPTYLVAYAMLNDVALRPGQQSVFVAGAAGGVGGALVEIAKMKNLTVVGSVGSEIKAAHALSIGADHVVDYRDEALIHRVKALTGGRGVDIAFDHIIGSGFTDLFDVLADFGTLVFYNVHAPAPTSDVFRRMCELSTRSLALRCFNIHSYDHYRERRRRLMEELIGLLAEGKIRPRVGLRLPMARVAEAHRLLEEGAVIGKIVLHA